MTNTFRIQLRLFFRGLIRQGVFFLFHHVSVRQSVHSREYKVRQPADESIELSIEQ